MLQLILALLLGGGSVYALSQNDGVSDGVTDGAMDETPDDMTDDPADDGADDGTGGDGMTGDLGDDIADYPDGESDEDTGDEVDGDGGDVDEDVDDDTDEEASDDEDVEDDEEDETDDEAGDDEDVDDDGMSEDDSPDDDDADDVPPDETEDETADDDAGEDEQGDAESVYLPDLDEVAHYHDLGWHSAVGHEMHGPGLDEVDLTEIQDGLEDVRDAAEARMSEIDDLLARVEAGELSEADAVAELFGIAASVSGNIFDDADGDGTADPGEGLGHVEVTAWNETGEIRATASWEDGNYSINLPEGTWNVVFHGEALDGIYETEVTVGDEDITLDVIEDRDAADLPLVYLDEEAWAARFAADAADEDEPADDDLMV